MAAAVVKDYAVTTQQALHDVDVQTAAGGIVDKLRQALGDGYAGVWFDDVAGKFKIDVAPSTDQHAAQQVEKSLGITSDAELVPVKYTWKQLTAVQARWAPRAAALPAADQTTVGINAPDNAVEITVAPTAAPAVGQQLDAQVQAAASSTPGPPVKVITAPVSMPTHEAACNFRYCDAPLRGGVGVGDNGNPPNTGPNDYNCTAGYVVFSPSPIGVGGYLYILTAGHCITESDTSSWWTFQSDLSTFRWVGPPASWFQDGRGDAAMIAITGPAFCFAFGGPCSGTNVAAYNAEYYVADWTGYFNDFPIYGDGSSYYGMPACHAGATSGFECGIDIYPSLIDVYFNEQDPYTGAWTYNVGNGTYNDGCTSGGDSGGPWFAGTTAFGIAATGNGCQYAGSMYTEIVPQLAQWGLSGADL